jgi:prepilin-type N-terminal cleavage/methylation domain-containing protein
VIPVRMPKPTATQHRSRGFTLVEMVLVIVLIALLAALLAPLSGTVRAKAQGARCAGNLRSLHAALGAYVSERGHWPQQPPELKKLEVQKWWVEELRPFGMTQEAWTCPALEKTLAERNVAENDRPFTHYMITQFDNNQFTPYRWATQPWAIEIGDVHGDGNLLIFPDGSIRSLKSIYRQANSPRGK